MLRGEAFDDKFSSDCPLIDDVEHGFDKSSRDMIFSHQESRIVDLILIRSNGPKIPTQKREGSFEI